MKKAIFVLSAAVLLAVSLSAQEPVETTTETTKTPLTTASGSSNSNISDGKFAIDVNFNPSAFFDSYADDMFEMPTIRGRYYISSDAAISASLGLSTYSSKSYSGTDADVYSKYSGNSISFELGLEKHRDFNNLSIYFGGGLGLYSTGSKSDEYDLTSDDNIVSKNPDGDDYFGFGINAILGFEYYVFSNLYLGAELTPGFLLMSYKDVTVDGDLSLTGGYGSSFSLGSSSGLVIGVRF